MYTTVGVVVLVHVPRSDHDRLRRLGTPLVEAGSPYMFLPNGRIPALLTKAIGTAPDTPPGAKAQGRLASPTGRPFRPSHVYRLDRLGLGRTHS